MIAAPTVTPMMRRPPPCERNSSMIAVTAIASSDSNLKKPLLTMMRAVRLGST